MYNKPSASVSTAKQDADQRLFGTDEPGLNFVTPRLGKSNRAEATTGLLRKRLIVVSLVFTVAPAVYAARALYFLSQGNPTPGAGWIDFILLITAFALKLGLLITLLFYKALSVRSLRAIELVGFGHAIALFAWWLFDQLQSGWLNDTGDHAAANTAILARFWVLPFFGSIMAYGTLIPNTWHRCAAVISCIVCCPLAVVIAVGLFGSHYSGSTLLLLLFEMVFWLAIGSGLAIFGAHRMEILRQRVAEARTLGQYKLCQRLGSGGMGEVYLAEHTLLRRPCAIKLIRPDRVGDPQNVVRFMQEVQATATLSHPNTVQVFDYGHAEDGTFYYVMEYLPGLTLEQLVKDHGPLPPERAIHFLRQICDALSEAHSIGLIHRDIKPSNVIICQRGGRHDTAKLLDFGLAVPLRMATGGESRNDGVVVAGTPAYMSPEQSSGQEVLDVRSDIYSIGAVAYFLLTGQAPFGGRPVAKMLAAHIGEIPVPLSHHRPDVSVDLETLVLRCLAKKPADRFSDVRSLQDTLTSCASGAEWTSERAAQWWYSRHANAQRVTSEPVNDPLCTTKTAL